MSIISVEGVTKHYSLGTQTVEALKGVTFDIKQGEFIAIMAVSYTHLTLPTKRIV